MLLLNELSISLPHLHLYFQCRRYTGPDCSQRMCVSGVDPLYTDDTTVRVTHTTVRFESSVASALSGKYSIKFYDYTGEDWITNPISISGTGVINGKTHCESVSEALLELPGEIIPTIECSQTVISTNKGVEYTLTFTGNPGHLRELELDQYLDGSRSTVTVSSGTMESGVNSKVIGETEDYFAQRCEGLTVKVLADSADADDSWTSANVRPGSLGYLSGPMGPLTPAEKKLLKKCLGDSDWDSENNVEVSNWDTGVVVENDGASSYNMIGAFPHAIKVVPVESTQDYNIHMPGSYHLVWYDADATDKEFRVTNLNSAANVVGEADEMYVYTTQGTVQQMGWGTEDEIADNSAGGASSTRIVGYFDKSSNRIYTNYDTSCKSNPSSPNPRNHVCVKKGDKLFVVDSCWGRGDQGAGTVSPIFGGTALNECDDSTVPSQHSGNIYTVTKVSSPGHRVIHFVLQCLTSLVVHFPNCRSSPFQLAQTPLPPHQRQSISSPTQLQSTASIRISLKSARAFPLEDSRVILKTRTHHQLVPIGTQLGPTTLE